MTQVLSLTPLPSLTPPNLPYRPRCFKPTRFQHANHNWGLLLQNLKCKGKFSCLFSDNRREEQAKKALESALGGKRNEFEKWNKEIKRREEVGGGGGTGGGGWFGSGGWFGWFSGDHFWQEAQQASLTILGIILMYLLIAKGELLLAVVFNPLLYALRRSRDGLTFVTSRITGKKAPDTQANFDDLSEKKGQGFVSAKERVLRKWGSE